MLRAIPLATACFLAADTAAGTETKLLEYGVIGALLISFIWWSRADKEKSDKKWDDTNAAMMEMIRGQTTAATQATDAAREQTEAVRDLSAALRERPCLIPNDNRR
jgi:hypothetical protein